MAEGTATVMCPVCKTELELGIYVNLARPGKQFRGRTELLVQGYAVVPGKHAECVTKMAEAV